MCNVNALKELMFRFYQRPYRVFVLRRKFIKEPDKRERGRQESAEEKCYRITVGGKIKGK